MREWADFTTEQGEDGATTIAFSGPLIVSAIGPAERRLRAVSGAVARLDLTGVREIDTVGAWVVWRMARDSGAEIAGASDKAARLIAAVKGAQGTSDLGLQRAGVVNRVVESIGRFVREFGLGILGITSFLGALLIAAWQTILSPRRLRATALVRHLELVGVSALGIIGLMSFLVGIVIAQQGAVQLQQFGAEMLTVNLTGRLSMRELGVLMTAIMVAGRSGSAFAAQIGTMKLTEEIDAMRTIGVSPVEALVLPRLLAAVIMMPLLGFYAALAAIVGGAFISAFTLDIPFFTFLNRIQEVVPIKDVWVGLVKAVLWPDNRYGRVLSGHAGESQCRGSGPAHHAGGGAGDLHGHRA